MRILIISPTLEDAEGRGINAIAKNLINSVHALGHEVGLLTGIPRHKNIQQSYILNQKIEHVILQNYLTWGRKSFGFIVKGGYSKRNALTATIKGDIYKSSEVRIAKEFLGKQPGNVLKSVDFCVESPYVYQYITRNHERTIKKILSGVVRRHKIDLIIATSPVPIDSAWFGKKVKVAQFIHDVMPLEILETPPDNNTPYTFGVQFLKAASKSDTVFVNSIDTKNKVIEVNKNANIHVLYGALPNKKPDTSHSSILTLKGLEKDNYLLFNSVVEKRKNVENLIEAYSLIYDKIKMPLVIVGAPGYGFKDILKKYNSLPEYIKNNILFTGWLSNIDRLKLFENANSFIFPSLYEGLGIGILEAMEYSLPILTTKVGALAEIGEDAVYYISDPYNPAEIASGILEIVTNNTLRNSLVRRGQEVIPKYSQAEFDKRAQNAILDVLKEVQDVKKSSKKNT